MEPLDDLEAFTTYEIAEEGTGKTATLESLFANAGIDMLTFPIDSFGNYLMTLFSTLTTSSPSSTSTTSLGLRWILDSGSSFHTVNALRLLTSYKRSNKPVHIRGAFSSRGFALGYGSLKVQFNNHSILISPVLYVPKIDVNPISQFQLMKQGHTFPNTRTSLSWIDQDGNLVVKCPFGPTHIPIPARQLIPPPAINMLTASPTDLNIWHKRFRHMGEACLKQVGGLVEGFNLCNGSQLSPCKPCAMGKIQVHPNRQPAQHHPTLRLQLILSDLWGPASTVACSGYCYVVGWWNAASREMWAEGIQMKDEASAASKCLLRQLQHKHSE